MPRHGTSSFASPVFAPPAQQTACQRPESEGGGEGTTAVVLEGAEAPLAACATLHAPLRAPVDSFQQRGQSLGACACGVWTEPVAAPLTAPIVACGWQQRGAFRAPPPHRVHETWLLSETCGTATHTE